MQGVLGPVIGPGVHHGDCFDLLERVEPNSVDLTLVDPPYNTRREDSLETMGRTSMNYPWDGPIDHLKWLELQDKALKPGGSLVVFYDQWHINELSSMVEVELGYMLKRPVVWRKTNPMPGNRSRLPAQAIELGFWAVKPGGSWIFNCPEELSYCDFLWFDTGVPRSGKGQPRHEAKKHVDLFKGLIEILTLEGATVLDPFCGGGTTAVACARTGRTPICIEKDQGWAEEARFLYEKEIS